MVERLAGDVLHQLGRGVALALGVNLLPQPVAQGEELAEGELPLQAAQVVIGLAEELRGGALLEIEAVAADAAQAMIQRVAGLNVDADTARAAVAKELANG